MFKFVKILLLLSCFGSSNLFAASYLSVQSGKTEMTVDGTKSSIERTYEGKQARVHYIESVPRLPNRYGVYLQASELINKKGGEFFESNEKLNTIAVGIETSLWLPSLSFVEFVVGFSLQSGSFESADEDQQNSRKMTFTQGIASRIGLILSPSLGPLAISIEAGGEIGRFTDGADSDNSRAFLPPVKYQAASLLAGGRIRF